MAKFIVADRLGKTVAELEDTMTEGEMAHWAAYLKIIAKAGK